VKNYRRVTSGLAVAAAAMCVTFGSEVKAQDVEAEAVPESEKVSSEEGLRLNFRGVPLDTVLDYLSKEAGFTIVREAQVEGRVDVWSHQPLNKDEVVDLLNTVLNAKGCAAIRSGRTLTIVSREEARTRNIPVRTSADPEEIPNTDEMVTQIIPVRFADATKLIENLQPLLASYAVASANESSNAIVLTDTQANIKRMVEIVQALDTSISSITEVKVFPLTYADAQETAQLITRVFEVETANVPQNAVRRIFGRGGPFGPGGDQPPDSGESPARQAVSRVVAVAETRTNAVVVGAPAELIAAIANLVDEIDTVSDADVQIRVFPLDHADATEMAELIMSVFEEGADSSRLAGMPQFAGAPMPFAAMMASRQQRDRATRSRSSGAADAAVVAQADTRTNSVVVSAAAELMDEIAAMVDQLDANPARNKKVFVYSLKNADAESAAYILENMFNGQGSTGRTSSALRTNRNTNATTRGINQNPVSGRGATGGASGGGMR
jgi:general secretion pathway protein D